MTKTIALLGATGSIGRQTLEVAGRRGSICRALRCCMTKMRRWR